MASIVRFLQKLVPAERHFLSQQHRSMKRYVAPMLRELKLRQKIFPKQEPAPRSSFIEWNYKAELMAFGARLGENFKEETLRIAFTHESYVKDDEKMRKMAGLTEEHVLLQMKHSNELITEGDGIIRESLLPMLRFAFPLLPEEGICSILDYLMSTDVLAHVSSNLGITDLVLCATFPPDNLTMADTLKAVVAALHSDTDKTRVDGFIRDFLLTQLIGKDVNSLWELSQPLKILTEILNREGKAEPEPRLVRTSGQNTILAVYQVAFYSTKSFLGIGSGETLSIAEEEAARDSLKRFFGTRENQPSIPFRPKDERQMLGQRLPNLNLNEWTNAAAAAMAAAGN